MSCRLSTIVLKKCSHITIFNAIKCCHKDFVVPASTICRTEKKDLNETIQVSNHFKPLINRPIKEILSSIDPKQTSPTETVTILKVFRMQTLFNKIPPETFRSDSRFQFLCEKFQKNCDILSFPLLISGLRSLLEVGMPADSPCVVSAEREILINCSKFNALMLIRCLHFHHKFLESDLQKQILNTLEEELVKKLSNVSTSAEVLLLCTFYHLFKEAHKKKVESKIIELVSHLNVHEMCKVIISFSQQSNRNVSILNAIAFHMRLKPENLDIKETVDILYAFKKLNYFESKLFPHLLNKTCLAVPNITQPSLVSGILTTCGYLKYKHIDLLDACADWIQNNVKACRIREFISFILANASLNYNTEKIKTLIVLMMPYLTEKSIDSKNIFLDVAWSLAILKSIPKEMLLKTLSPGFYKSLLDASDTQTASTNKLKLMNLKGVLKMKYPDHVFQCSLYLEPIKLKESSDIENSRIHVIKVLSNFVPMDKYLRINQANDIGIFIDAEFIMDRNLKPLSITEFGTLAQATKNTKYLPKGAKRIALLIFFHKDYTLGIRHLTGINALAVNLLSHFGYLVVQIPYDEFIRNTTEVQKAKYLMQKIKLSIENVKNL